MKLLLKQAFYFCDHPPGILLSLLPAPQQAILNFEQEIELEALYGIQLHTGMDESLAMGEDLDEEENKVIDSLAEVEDEENIDDMVEVDEVMSDTEWDNDDEDDEDDEDE